MTDNNSNTITVTLFMTIYCTYYDNIIYTI